MLGVFIECSAKKYFRSVWTYHSKADFKKFVVFEIILDDVKFVVRFTLTLVFIGWHFVKEPIGDESAPRKFRCLHWRYRNFSSVRHATYHSARKMVFFFFCKISSILIILCWFYKNFCQIFVKSNQLIPTNLFLLRTNWKLCVELLSSFYKIPSN